MSVVLFGTTSGSVTLQEPAIAGSTVIDLPATTGTALVAPTALTVPNTTGTVMVSGNMPAFSAYAGASTTLSSGSWVKVLFNTEEFDTNNNFASSTFTPTVAGYYQISATVDVDAQSAANNLTRAVAAIYKNGSIYKCGGTAWVTVNGTREFSCPVSSVVYFNGSTDYIEIYVNCQTSGGTPITGPGQPYTWINGTLVRAA